VAVYRTHDGWVSLPVAWVKGHQLAAHQGATVSGDNLFVGGTATLTAAGRAQLRILAAALRRAHGITCEGYTDYATPPALAAASATARATAVCNQLKAFGVRAGRTVVGYSSGRPVVIGGPANKRSRNRRVIVLMRW
jgi:outer membrane protein OmpA-like peptidoglycan-associated protein